LKRVEEKRREIKQKLDRILNSGHPRGAYVVTGEVYVEGITHGEAVSRGMEGRTVIVYCVRVVGWNKTELVKDLVCI
jgi:3-dehydroquinate synthetase